MSELDGKVALVTGAASGIGAACVTRFLDDGARVVGVDLAGPDRDLDLEPGVDGAAFAQLDVRDEAAIEAVVAAVVEQHGRHRRGRHRGGRRRWWPGAPRRSRRMAARARHQPHRHVPRVQARDRADARSGHRSTASAAALVTIASVEGLEGTAGGSSYNASKGAVVILTKNLAIDYGGQGIRANAICPGFIETPMLDGVFGMPGMEAVLADITHEHKLRRLGRPSRDRVGRRVPDRARRVVRHRSGDRGRRRLHGRPQPRRDRAHRVVGASRRSAVHARSWWCDDQPGTLASGLRRRTTSRRPTSPRCRACRSIRCTARPTASSRASTRTCGARTRRCTGRSSGRCGCSPGFGTAVDTNRRFHELLAAGGRRPLDRVRPADADGPRLRRRARARRGRSVRRRGRHARRCRGPLPRHRPGRGHDIDDDQRPRRDRVRDVRRQRGSDGCRARRSSAARSRTTS